ncbi:hypothetical protein BDV95DRAFT_335738 [Massariosphaeria phaeospora]|uniref:Uncharacterized protein n=1 Tax=Massariosphaeria phaeospora TaxID=100035 RepID=A0A7C8MEC9_9PLEO|nr:hypothetical protein BDV95DRAFT_335738 [Massariosphaeria phaeospora]
MQGRIMTALTGHAHVVPSCPCRASRFRIAALEFLVSVLLSRFRPWQVCPCIPHLLRCTAETCQLIVSIGIVPPVHAIQRFVWSLLLRVVVSSSRRRSHLHPLHHGPPSKNALVPRSPDLTKSHLQSQLVEERTSPPASHDGLMRIRRQRGEPLAAQPWRVSAASAVLAGESCVLRCAADSALWLSNRSVRQKQTRACGLDGERAAAVSPHAESTVWSRGMLATSPIPRAYVCRRSPMGRIAPRAGDAQAMASMAHFIRIG